MKKAPVILVLGMSHFSSSQNGDMFSNDIEDILSSQRQKELKNLVNSLKHYKPTKIALEHPAGQQDRILKEYQSFLQNRDTLRTGEQYQIGFRLAKAMGHTEVFGVDWNRSLDCIPDMEEWVRKNGSENFQKAMKKAGKLAENRDMFLKTHTIPEFLSYLNKPSTIKEDHQTYMQLALVGDTSNPVGAMWTAQYWYYRNMLIYKNIVDLIDSDQERIFVLYGSGHLHLLTQFLKESGIFIIESVHDFLNREIQI